MSTNNSFVRVYGGNPTQGGKFAGTAFFITPQKLLTAKHVVNGCKSGVFLHGLPGGSSLQITADNIEYCDNDRDVALLHTAKPFDVSPVLPATTAPQTGQAIMLYGFFDTSQELHTRSTIVSGYVGIQNSWQIADGVKKGMSGGAVLRDGELLGVLYARDEEVIISYFIPIDVIADWLGDSVPGFGDYAISATDITEQQRASQVFVGRHDELAILRNTLLGENQAPVAITALHGMAGVGKSWLADHFYATHKAHFPGGYLRLTLDAENPASADTLLAELAERCELSVLQHTLAKRLRQRLISPKTLVHIENLDAEEAVKSATQFCNQLPDCAIVLSGRIDNFGKAKHWPQVSLKPFQQKEALQQLTEEITWLGGVAPEPGEAKELVRVLGGLPLAIHIAAGYLSEGDSVADFLEELQLTGYDLPPADASDDLLNRDAARAVLHSTFRISLDLLAKLGAKRGIEAGDSLFHALGFAPLSGFGFSIAQALLGLDAPQCRSLLRLAQRLSLIDMTQERRWQVHPLLADYLRQNATNTDATEERLNRWFLTRLPEPKHAEAQQCHGRHELNEESLALAEWLDKVPDDMQISVERSGSQYAIYNGPFVHWMLFCQRALNNPAHDEEQRSNILFTLMYVAQNSGNMEQAMEYAELKYQLDLSRDEPGKAALAKGQTANILQARGQLGEALRIRQHEELPVYESLGDVRSIAITKSQIADILQKRGQLDEALRILKHEVLPIFESREDVREIATAKGGIADILQAKGQLDEALCIRREEQLPVYESLGDMHSIAITQGQIADILQGRGKLDEALRIRQHEELPVHESLGDVREVTITRSKIADILQKRGQLDEALRIHQHEVLPIFESLGEVHEIAITKGQIADILFMNGEHDGAIELYENALLPTLESLGDKLGLLVDQANLAIKYIQTGKNQQRAKQLLCTALQSAYEMQIPEAEQIKETLEEQGWRCD